MQVLRNIKERYSELSKSNKKIADYILSSTKDVVGQTAQEIGHFAGVSPATVVRFAKTIGFSSMEDMKIQLSAELYLTDNDEKIDPIVSKSDSLDVLCLKTKKIVEETTSDLFTLLDLNCIQEAIRLIKNSNTIYLFGIGSSSIPVSDLFHKFNRAGYKTFFSQDVHIGLEMLANITVDDVILCFSYSGYTKEIVLVIDYAFNNNIPVIIVTRNKSELLKQKVTVVLEVPSNEHLLRVGAISSLYSSMIISTLLYLGVIQEDIEEGIEHKMIETKKIINPLKDEEVWN